MDISTGRLRATDQGVLRRLDPVLVLAAVGLAVYGLFMVYSASWRGLELAAEDPGFYMKKQAGIMMLGVIAMMGVATFNFRLVKVYAGVAFAAVIVLLFVVLTPLGSEHAGAQRWISLPGFQLQPSEFAKLALVAVLAAYLSEIKGEMDLRQVGRATAMAAGPMALVMVQPDLGTSMVFAATLIGMLVVAGTRPKHLGVVLLGAIVATFLALSLGIIRDYQLARLASFFGSDADPLAAGYNKEQSLIAIGAGGIGGVGYLKGPQTTLDFVPQQHTDFIFTAVGEELGFLGAMVLLMLFGLVLWRGFRIALSSKDPFGTLVATGIVSMLAFQVFVNIGMTIGIMPVTGIPLPLVSYGGSALITNFMAIGLLLSVQMRRFQ
ncbi:MAG: rod shape-determining protein RodA [Actinomycetota bacterium]|nr:rod shape-determining protein RodA [Actinomycetota bacterium]